MGSWKGQIVHGLFIRVDGSGLILRVLEAMEVFHKGRADVVLDSALWWLYEE